MNGLLNHTFLFLITFSVLKPTHSASIQRNHVSDYRVAEPNFNALCQPHSKQVLYLTQKIVCIFCKGFDVSCFPTTGHPPSSSTAKPLPSSSVKSTFPASSSVSVSSTKAAEETSTASIAPDA